MLVTSDLHLSDKIWKNEPIWGDSYYSWRQIVDLAIDHECDGVILAGDLLDKQINVSKPVKALVDGLRQLAVNDIEVYYNQGQHEYQEAPWMSLDESVIWFRDESFSLGPLQFAGCDFQDAEGLALYLQSDEAKKADVLVCHQVWLEFMGEECKPQGSFYDIPENVKYLITGDYHESICQKYGHLTVISPGSTHLRSISETQDKNVYFMSFPDDPNDDSGAVSIVAQPLLTRRKIEINAVAAKEHDVFTHIETGLAAAASYAETYGLPEDIRKPLLRLTYIQSENDVVNKVDKLVGDRAHMFYKPVKLASPEDLLPSLTKHIDAEERVGMLGCLDTYVDKEKKPLTHSLATRLLQAPDPEQALHKWIKEQIS